MTGEEHRPRAVRQNPEHNTRCLEVLVEAASRVTCLFKPRLELERSVIMGIRRCNGSQLSQEFGQLLDLTWFKHGRRCGEDE